jgi:hypothetical protein
MEEIGRAFQPRPVMDALARLGRSDQDLLTILVGSAEFFGQL